MTTNTINPTSTNLRQDIDRIAHKADSLVDSGAQNAKEKIEAAREHVDHAFERGQELYGLLHGQTVAGLQKVDRLIHTKPYHAIGVSIGLGVIIGYLLAERVISPRT